MMAPAKPHALLPCGTCPQRLRLDLNGCAYACRAAVKDDVYVTTCSTLEGFEQSRRALKWRKLHNETISLHWWRCWSAKTIVVGSHDSTLSMHLPLTHQEIVTSSACSIFVLFLTTSFSEQESEVMPISHCEGRHSSKIKD